MLNILSWNINRNTDAWQCVLESDYDVALLQEAALPSASISDAVEILKHIVGLESIYEHGVIDGDGETVLVAQYYGIGEDVSLFHFGDVDLTATFELV